MSESETKDSVRFFSYPGNFFIASIYENANVKFEKGKISISKSKNKKTLAHFYYKKSLPVVVDYTNFFNEITIYFKPLGILHFLRDIEFDFQKINSTVGIPFRDYLTEMNKILPIKDRNLQIEALENYWLSLIYEKDIKHLEKILEYVEENTKISEIARELNVSRQYIHKVFLKYIGKSPTDYRKIQRFRNLILNHTTDKKLTSLSLNAMYYDQAHFNKQFKEITNLSPRSFFCKY
ncbi:helix-turn-helix domain-containing protein [Empedobacter brevis]|uniref:helix-turn-helix domain-containing protein n=1 Tax=Empedobacter brevis TaxID=247 RepID=UPI0023EFD451|nr:helix-turn-helix domain-containing protein [Empedobacter brevis]